MGKYTAFRKYEAQYCPERNELIIGFIGYEGFFTAQIKEASYRGKAIYSIDDFKKCTVSTSSNFDSTKLHILYSEGPIEQQTLAIDVSLDKNRAYIRVGAMGHLNVMIQGNLCFGDPGRAVCLDRRGTDLRAAYGYATSIEDNALFNVNRDAAIEIHGPNFRMKYDKKERCYAYTMKTSGDDVERDYYIELHEDVYARKYGIYYAPLNHDTCFPKPPVGWMTWYAVQFDACENQVLKNAEFQKEHLAPYGANAIWVDWEWYHQDFSGTGKKGTDIFHPDPDRYPHGLKFIAERIKEMGFVPALWIGATNDPVLNEYYEKNPEVVLVQKRSWCGQYFIDPTNPKIQKEYIPSIFNNIREMGYEALKWDCLPISFEQIDDNHEKLYDPSVSTDEAMRELVKIARNCVGEKFYMLSCSGESMRDILFAGDIFNAARIGGDIFRWKEFVANGVDRILKIYPFHNTLFYADPDNVVIREKYNTLEQAISRASLVSILGLPFTFGDILEDLDESRLYLLQHSIPSLDIHPMDIRNNIGDSRQLIVNLAIAMDWEDWNVIDVLNLLEKRNCVRISLESDLHLSTDEKESYLLFDFWNRRYLGEVIKEFTLTLPPCASRIIGVRKKTGNPQILSTTRHITQGALELSNVKYDEVNMILRGESEVVAGDDYAIFLYLPENMRVFFESNETTFITVENVGIASSVEDVYGIQSPDGSVWKLQLPCENNGKVKWSIAFAKCHGAN